MPRPRAGGVERPHGPKQSHNVRMLYALEAAVDELMEISATRSKRFCATRWKVSMRVGAIG
jgi:hypothetical protein